MEHWKGAQITQKLKIKMSFALKWFSTWTIDSTRYPVDEIIQNFHFFWGGRLVNILNKASLSFLQ